MELSSIDDSKPKLVGVLVKCINNLCREINRPKSKQKLRDSLNAMQLFESILYRINHSSIIVSKEEYIAQLASIYHIMNDVFGSH